MNGRLDLAGHIFSAVFIDAKRLLDDYPALKSHLKEYMELKELTKLYHAFIEFDKLVAKKPLESFFQTRYGGFTNAVERAEYETKIEKWTQDITVSYTETLLIRILKERQIATLESSVQRNTADGYIRLDGR